MADRKDRNDAKIDAKIPTKTQLLYVSLIICLFFLFALSLLLVFSYLLNLCLSLLGQRRKVKVHSNI